MPLNILSSDVLRLGSYLPRAFSKQDICNRQLLQLPLGASAECGIGQRYLKKRTKCSYVYEASSMLQVPYHILMTPSSNRWGPLSLTLGHAAGKWPAVFCSWVYLAPQSLLFTAMLYYLSGLVLCQVYYQSCVECIGHWAGHWSSCRTVFKEVILGQAQVIWDPRKKLDWPELPMRPTIPRGNFCFLKFLHVALCTVVIVKLSLVWGLHSSRGRLFFLCNFPCSPCPTVGKITIINLNEEK